MNTGTYVKTESLMQIPTHNMLDFMSEFATY